MVDQILVVSLDLVVGVRFVNDAIFKIVGQLMEAVSHPPDVKPQILPSSLLLLFVLKILNMPFRFILILLLVFEALVVTRGLTIVNQVYTHQHHKV